MSICPAARLRTSRCRRVTKGSHRVPGQRHGYEALNSMWFEQLEFVGAIGLEPMTCCL